MYAGYTSDNFPLNSKLGIHRRSHKMCYLWGKSSNYLRTGEQCRQQRQVSNAAATDQRDRLTFPFHGIDYIFFVSRLKKSKLHQRNYKKNISAVFPHI